jgi:hypothetical protein
MKTLEEKFAKVSYEKLNSKQQESFNYQKVSAKMADYGFVTILLNDDWNGADFIALHANKKSIIKVQLKGRLSFNRNYIGKDLYIAFQDKNVWYLYPHDYILEEFKKRSKPDIDRTWIEKGTYSQKNLSGWVKEMLSEFIVE